MTIQYKHNEKEIIEGIQAYVDATYNQHYSSGESNRDVIDDWEDMGIAKQAHQSNIIKYAKRFGKKGGENPKDIIKIIHYSILLLNEVQRQTGQKHVDTTPDIDND